MSSEKPEKESEIIGKQIRSKENRNNQERIINKIKSKMRNRFVK